MSVPAEDLASTASAILRERGDRPRVLIVDDDAPIRALLVAVLDRNGVASTVATDGAHALHLLAGVRFDAIILDLMMPKVDGFEVLDRLDAMDPGCAQRTVVVVSAAAQQDLRRLERERVFRVIRKPFELGELTAALRSCLEGRAGG